MDESLRDLEARLAPLDEEALVALANRGLVRRARKDLGRVDVRVVAAAGDAATVEVEDLSVELTPNPSEARCPCPATGTCRHILVAILHIQERAAGRPAESQPDPKRAANGAGERSAAAAAPPATAQPSGGEVLALTDGQLKEWAGATLYKRALQAVARGIEASISEQDGRWRAHIYIWNETCRWLPGAGLTGMLCSCHARGPCVHRLLAVLSFQIQRGVREAAEAGMLLAKSGTPRTRDEVREATRRALAEMVELGLTRLGDTTVRRLRTLGHSAQGVDLPLLSRRLAALADESEAFLARNAGAASASLLTRAAHIDALAQALARPTPALVGEHRARYEPVKDLELSGLGARPWRVRSGYRGLTVYLWDHTTNSVATWTDARPDTMADFDPINRFHAPGPWTGCPSPANLSTSHVRLQIAHRTIVGRLSGRSATHMTRLGPTAPETLREASIAGADLATRALSCYAGGLAPADLRQAFICLYPIDWHQPDFDDVRQQLIREVTLDDGRRLPLVLTHEDLRRTAIEQLERLEGAKAKAVFGRLFLYGERLALEPVSVVDKDGRLTSLGLDVDSEGETAEAKSNHEAPAPDDEPEVEQEAETDHIAPIDHTPTGRLCRAALDLLESMAEQGHAFRAWNDLQDLTQRAETLGLTRLKRALEALRKSATTAEEEPQTNRGPTCLRATYTARLTARIDALLSSAH